MGLERHNKYVRNYLDVSNAYASMYLSAVVIVLELWMIVSLVINIFSGGRRHDNSWIIKHLSAYVALLLAAIHMLVHGIKILRGKHTNRNERRLVTALFSILCLIFGMYISYLDYAKGEQVLAFVTMELFVFSLIIWRPILSFLALAASFGMFYWMCDRAIPASYSYQVNLFTTWLAIVMAEFNVYQQKIREAKKTEHLESVNEHLKSITVDDELTGIPNMHSFRNRVMAMLQDESIDISTKTFLFLDIENFKNYNDMHGFWAGNAFLISVAQTIRDTFAGELVARFSDDHFVVFAEREGVQEKLSAIKSHIQSGDTEIHLGLKTGAYTPQERGCSPITACDHARYACNSIKKKSNQDFCEYTDQMDSFFIKKQYVLNNIDTALEKGWIKVYYQPVVWAEDKKLCGLEALARWEDPKYGMLSPAIFVPVLEEYRQIHKLDMYILNRACHDTGEAYKNNLPVIPVSINFSRLDFDVSDVVAEVNACVQRHGISKNDIHIEITESALTENDVHLRKAMEQFRAEGYSLWLDDFGSGYSGLNVLKEYQFDMMKIDMKFLHNFSENQKTQPILKNVIALAREIGMQTLTEGVETPEASEFLHSIGCDRLQGFLFGKPMPIEQLRAEIAAGTYIVE